jgi:hypothetical protein
VVELARELCEVVRRLGHAQSLRGRS